MRQFHSFTGDNAARTCTRSKEQIAKPIDNKAIYLLRHIYIKRPRSGHKMSKTHTTLLRDYGHGHSRSEIIDNNDNICRIGHKVRFKPCHDHSCQFIQTATFHPKKHIRAGYLQINEQRRLKCRVIFRPSINELEINVTAIGLCPVYCPYYRSNLYEIRARTSHNTNITHDKYFLYGTLSFCKNNNIIARQPKFAKHYTKYIMRIHTAIRYFPLTSKSRNHTKHNEFIDRKAMHFCRNAFLFLPYDN